MQGETAIAEGRYKDAVKLLSEFIEKIASRSANDYYLTAESLAIAWEKTGDLPQAIRVLEYDGRQRLRIRSGMYGAYWLHNQALLADFYRKAGRVGAALKVEEELGRLLSVADPDHPILRQIRQAQHLP